MKTDPFLPRLPRPAIVLLVLGTFLVINAVGLSAFRAWGAGLAGWPRMAALAVLGYGLYLAGPLAVAALLFGRRRMVEALGLAASPWPALALAAACTSIIWVGYAASAPLVPLDGLAISIMRGALLPGAAEEILFRAFLFGFLFRFAGWGFLPAALLSSLVFGLEHLYQGNDATEALGILLLTGIGGVWWSWLLAEWRWNAWVPMAFHVGMNAAFETFAIADNALGPTSTIVLRQGCIALSIVATLAIARRGGGRAITGWRWLRGAPPGDGDAGRREA
jgi:membrane protease YdiL (CAAX protease family)